VLAGEHDVKPASRDTSSVVFPTNRDIWAQDLRFAAGVLITITRAGWLEASGGPFGEAPPSYRSAIAGSAAVG
jgi:hypothetical protein